MPPSAFHVYLFQGKARGANPQTLAVINSVIESDLVLDIVELTIEDEKYHDQIRHQIPFLTESETEHTGTGLYVYFSAGIGIDQYRLNAEQLNQMFGQHNHTLTKFELINTHLNVLADVSVHFSNGIVECIEIWNKLGSFPTDELLTYELKRLDQ